MEKTYIYCDVLPENYQNSFYYIADYSAKVGDIVIIPIRSNDNLKVGIIQEVYECDQYEVPWPVRETKHILRKFSKEDELNKKLALEKKHIENQFGIQNLTEDQELKKELKNNLSKLGIRKDEIEATKLQIQNLIAKFAEKITTAKQERVLSYEDAGGIELSADGKTVIGYNGNKNKVKGVIKIPAGVESINDNVFERKNFDKLIINKELKNIGWSTLFIDGGPDDYYLRHISYIEVDPNNPNYYADDVGLYRRITNTTMELIFAYKTDITEYETPQNVVSLADRSLWNCYELNKIVLGCNLKNFNENCLCESTKVSEVYIPETVETFTRREDPTDYVSGGHLINCKVSEKSKHIFVSDGTIYQNLPQGGYKVVGHSTRGITQISFLDGTVEIGENAFARQEKLTSVILPDSLHTIRKNAFKKCGFSEIHLPNSIKRIEESAFKYSKIRKINFPASIEYIDTRAFESLYYDSLVIEVDSNSEYSYYYRNGKIRKEQKGDAQNIAKISSNEEVMYNVIDTFFNNSTVDGTYNIEHQTFSLIFGVDQRSEDFRIVNNRVVAAESLKEGMDVSKMTLDAFRWEIFDATHRSLGEISCHRLIPFFNRLNVNSVTAYKVRPKSQKRSNAKYADISIKVDFSLRDVSHLSSKDREHMTRFSYCEESNEIVLLAWIGNTKDKKVCIPSRIEGIRVKKICSGFFDYNYKDNPCFAEELIFEEGLQKIEAATIYNLEKLKKVVFPKTIENINSRLFRRSSYYVSDDCLINYIPTFDTDELNHNVTYFAPKNSYAERFLKNYKPEDYSTKSLRVSILEDKTNTKEEQ